MDNCNTNDKNYKVKIDKDIFHDNILLILVYKSKIKKTDFIFKNLHQNFKPTSSRAEFSVESSSDSIKSRSKSGEIPFPRFVLRLID